jgi:hypothetical protein
MYITFENGNLYPDAAQAEANGLGIIAEVIDMGETPDHPSQEDYNLPELHYCVASDMGQPSIFLDMVKKFLDHFQESGSENITQVEWARIYSTKNDRWVLWEGQSGLVEFRCAGLGTIQKLMGMIPAFLAS